MTKNKYIIVLILVIALIMIVFVAYKSSSKNTTAWGRDTVKQFCDGYFEILRSPGMYSFHSSDNKVWIDGITHYYDNGLDIYLIGESNLYACVDTLSGTVEIHDSVNEFDSAEQQIFNEKVFVKIRTIGVSRNIWDILFNK